MLQQKRVKSFFFIFCCLTAWRAGHSKIMCSSSATATEDTAFPFTASLAKEGVTPMCADSLRSCLLHNDSSSKAVRLGLRESTSARDLFQYLDLLRLPLVLLMQPPLLLGCRSQQLIVRNAAS